MDKLTITIAALILWAAPAVAANYTASDIAKLPQDMVAAARRDCASRWDSNFDMRIYCENKQFDALQRLIDRGSIIIKPASKNEP
jgi:hypothetical protein